MNNAKRFNLQELSVLKTAILSQDEALFSRIRQLGSVRMLRVEERIESFANVPDNIKALAKDLAVNGFYYTGVSMSNMYLLMNN